MPLPERRGSCAPCFGCYPTRSNARETGCRACRKVLDLLLLAVFENAEVLLGQIRGHCSFLVKDDHLDSNEVRIRTDVIHTPMRRLLGRDHKSK